MAIIEGTSAPARLALVLLGIIACSSSLEEEGGASGNTNPLLGDESGPALSDGNGDGLEDFTACAGQSAGAEASPTVLQLIVDTSGSMDDDAPGPVRGSKWQATRRAILQAMDRMPAATAVGVVFYPDVANDDDDDAPCFDRQADVSLDVLGQPNSQQRRSIQQEFQRQNPRGGTPTHDAYTFGVQELEASTLPGPRFAVVITDGVPTFSLGCDRSGRNQDDAVDPAPLVLEAAGSLARGMRTFVIGSPGSQGARESLSRMAEAGGTASAGCSHTGPRYCHFDMTEQQDFAAALADALGQITGLALSCSYDIPTPSNGAQIDPARVNVLFSPTAGAPELITQSASESCSEGWRYSPDQTQVLLCESTCERVRSTSNGSLTLQFGCATRIR